MTERKTEKLPKFDYYEGDPEGFHVYSWSPAPPGTPTHSKEAAPTQVHLHIPIAGARLYFRFKGPGTLDRFIAALQDHRRDVWGDP